MSNLSPAPGTPQTGTKAIASGIVAGAAAFVGIWVADVDPFTGKEVASALVSAVIASGLIGGVTYGVKNKPR